MTGPDWEKGGATRNGGVHGYLSFWFLMLLLSSLQDFFSTREIINNRIPILLHLNKQIYPSAR